MPIEVLDSHQARNRWREMLDLVLIDDVDVVITRYSKPVVALLSYEDYLAVQHRLAQVRLERAAESQVTAEPLATMLATERLLAQDWNRPEEDEAWSDL